MYAEKQDDDRKPTMICEICGKPTYIREITKDGQKACDVCAREVDPWEILDFERK